MTMKPTSIISSLPRHATKRYPRRSLSDITHVMFHHSATMHGTQGPEDFARWHVNGHGWPGIAYTYAVYPDGRVVQCTELNEMAYHCKGRNRVSLSVVLAGHFSKHEPPLKQLESAADLMVHINNTIGRRLLLDWHDHHRPTDCPGVLFPRQKLADMITEKYAPKPPIKEEIEEPDEEPEPPYYDAVSEIEASGYLENGVTLALMFAVILIVLILYLKSPI